MLLVECGREHLPEREYAVRVVLGSFLGLECRVVEGAHDDVVIRQSDDDGRRLLIRDHFFRSTPVILDPSALPRGELATIAASELPGATILGDLPVLYGDTTVRVEADTVELGLDVFGGAFMMLTRLEEALPGDRDTHDRFPASASLGHRHGFLERPIVNEYAEVLWWALQRLWPGLERPERAFRVLPSHDVDWPYTSRGLFRESVGAALVDIFNRRNTVLATSRFRSAVEIRRGGRDVDPMNTFGFIMSQSEQRGLQSAFNFMTRHTSRRYDGDYSIDDPWIRKLMREVAGRGHEIGLHPSYSTYRDEAGIRLEFELLAQVCREEELVQQGFGGRQHFLRWTNPITWRLWDEAGLDYDSTVGYADVVGFRCGACYEFPVFDLEARRSLRLVERPLIAMETSLLHYAGVSPEQAVGTMRRIKETCRVFDGDFTILWHNSQLQTARSREAYAALLDP